jgi:putative addiction module component (TIGR02574 family)
MTCEVQCPQLARLAAVAHLPGFAGTTPAPGDRILGGGDLHWAWPGLVPWRRLKVVTAATKKLLDDALALSDDERMDLMAALSDSFEPAPAELSPQWTAEIEERIGQLERGEVEPVPWEQVEAKIRATLARR